MLGRYIDNVALNECMGLETYATIQSILYQERDSGFYFFSLESDRDVFLVNWVLAREMSRVGRDAG